MHNLQSSMDQLTSALYFNGYVRYVLLVVRTPLSALQPPIINWLKLSN
jgi:hypothetical protein